MKRIILFLSPAGLLCAVPLKSNLMAVAVLFLALAAVGWDGYAVHVERAIALIGLLQQRLARFGWTTANDPSLAVLCVQPPAGSPTARTIVERVVASGRAWIAPARFEGRDVVRICATHGESSEADLDELVAALEAARH